MDISELIELVLSSEGVTLPLLLVAGALLSVLMALHALILVIKRQKR